MKIQRLNALSDDTKVPEHKCPHCGVKQDGFAGEGAPEPGMIGICIKCAGLSIINPDLTARMPTEAENAELNANPEIIRLRHLLAKSQRVLKAANASDPAEPNPAGGKES
jgi:hypothetical protein